MNTIETQLAVVHFWSISLHFPFNEYHFDNILLLREVTYKKSVFSGRTAKGLPFLH